MKKLAELQARRAQLKKDGLAICDAAENAGETLSDDDTKKLEAINAEVKDIDAEIEKLNVLAAQRRSMEAINVQGEPTRSPAGANTVRDLNPATTGGFHDIAEFALAVRDACAQGAIADERLRSLQVVSDNRPRTQGAPSNFHTGGGSGGEGFSLPSAHRDAVFEVMEEVDEFGPMVDEEPTDARKVDMLANEETPWGSSGVQANWRSEGTQMSPSRLDDDSRTVTLHEIYAFVLATGELLADAPRMANRLTRRAGAAIAWKKNQAMAYGTGAGQPLGWQTSAAAVTVAKESGQSADTIVAANVLNMMSRLMVVQGDSPVWLANRNVIPQLATMTIGDQPVWLPPSGVAGATGGFLLGAPVMFTEHAKTLGDKGDLQLMSPKGYYSLRRDSGATLATSIHLYFDYNIEAFRWMTRFGGQPHLSAPVDAPSGGGGAGNSKSHFVNLAERA